MTEVDNIKGCDAEILVVTEEYFIGDKKFPQELIARIPFFCGEMCNMYESLTEGELGDFVQAVLAVANDLREVYARHPDVHLHVQVRFNMTYVNM